MNEYSEANIAFHQAIIKLGGCDLIVETTRNLFIHIRAMRTVSLRQDNKAELSIGEHLAIIGAACITLPQQVYTLDTMQVRLPRTTFTVT